jgi:hypothetical protein
MEEHEGVVLVSCALLAIVWTLGATDAAVTTVMPSLASIGGILNALVLWPAFVVIQAELFLDIARMSPNVWGLAIVIGGVVGTLGGLVLIRVMRAAGM